MNLKLIIVGAVSGFLSALIVDLNAFSKAPGATFNWNLAVGRWVSGAAAGALAGLGGSQA